jgi:hypothetical protein
MRYAIQFYGGAPVCGNMNDSSPDLPRMECVEVNFETLADAQAQADRGVAPGGPFDWAEEYEIMDYDALIIGTISDPAVASWRRA